MKTGNSAFDQADRLAERERLAGIARVQAAVRGMGDVHCMDCDEPIDPERRAALPSAERCIDCALTHERQKRRRA